MLRRQTLIALGVAALLGLFAVFLVNTFLNARGAEIANNPEGTTRIAVAAVPLDYGIELTPDKVKFLPYPTQSLPPGVFKTMEELLPAGKSRVALRPVLINQPLLATDVSGEGQNASIAALLPDGMRAATLQINDVSGVAGFVRPNDTVDVLITRSMVAGGGRNEQVTDVLLQNIRVIAMDQIAQDPSGQPAVSRTATLEVTPVDAQKLALGQQTGSLSLVLRKPGEKENIGTVETVSLNDLRYSYAAGARPPSQPNATGTTAPPKVQIRRIAPRRTSAPAPRPVAPPPPTTSSVEVLRGTETSRYEVGDYVR